MIEQDKDQIAGVARTASSVGEVLHAANELEESLYGGGFPNLNRSPKTDEAIADVVRAAAHWARGVQRAYGFKERQRRYKGAGVLPFFKAGSGFDAFDDDPVALLGEPPDEFVVPERIGRDLCFFEYAFSRSREPHLGQARSLKDPAERGIAFTLDNWNEIRRRLTVGYGRVVKRTLGLSNWIRSKIQELEAAVVPSVRRVGTGSHNRVKVQVSHAGSMRALELTHMQAEFLRGLGKDGSVIASRRTKMNLLKRIPELRPWVENRPPDPTADVANQARYGVAPEVQKTIWLGE